MDRHVNINNIYLHAISNVYNDCMVDIDNPPFLLLNILIL